MKLSYQSFREIKKISSMKIKSVLGIVFLSPPLTQIHEQPIREPRAAMGTSQTGQSDW